MRIDSAHRFAGQVKTRFDLQERVAPAKDPIGVSVSNKTVAAKSDDLKQALQKVDLRNISRDQLAQLGGMLFLRGEISATTAGGFIVFDGEPSADRSQSVDAIAFFEKRYSVVKQMIDKHEQGYGEALVMASSALNEIYNIDDFIKTARSQLSIQTTA